MWGDMAAGGVLACRKIRFIDFNKVLQKYFPGKYLAMHFLHKIAKSC
jgi:hypothetical protein